MAPQQHLFKDLLAHPSKHPKVNVAEGSSIPDF
jgi:hypothetical protein